MQDRTLERQFSLSWGCLICFLFGKIRRYRAVIREKAGFFRCELKKWKINLSNIVISAGSNHLPVGGAGSAEGLRVHSLSWVVKSFCDHEWSR